MAEPTLTPAPAGGQAPVNFHGAHVGPDYDVIEALPPAAADKLRLLRQRRDDALALNVPFEDVRTASAAKTAAANALRKLTDHPHSFGHNLPLDAPQVVAAQRLLDKLTDELQRLTDRQAARAGAWNAAGRVLTAVEDWLKAGRPGGTTLEAVDVDPKLAKGEKGLLEAVENRRRRVRELRADLARLAAAPFPSITAKQRMREQIEALAQRGAPDVTNLIEHDGEIIWPSMRLQSEVHGAQRALAFHEAVDVVGLVAYLLKPTLISALDALVDEEKDDAAALSHADRELRTAEAMGDLAAVEFDEAALVWSAMAQSLPVEHRADCSPLAILGCRLVTPAAPNAQGPSSWMHAYDVVRPDGR